MRKKGELIKIGSIKIWQGSIRRVPFDFILSRRKMKWEALEG